MKMDPRITAYAVGELESREREIFESELSASSTLQNEVAAIALLADKLAAGPRKHERFDPEIRAWLLDRCLDKQKSRLRAKRTIVWTGLGLAASLVAYIGFDWIKPEQKPWQQPFRSCGLPEEPAFQSQAAPEAAAASDHAHYPGVQSVVDPHLQALEKIKYCAELLQKGNTAVAEGDYESAYAFFKSAVDTLPQGVEAVSDLRKQALGGFCNAAVSLARQRVSEGRYADARTIVEVVLENRYDPNYSPATALKSQLAAANEALIASASRDRINLQDCRLTESNPAKVAFELPPPDRSSILAPEPVMPLTPPAASPLACTTVVDSDNSTPFRVKARLISPPSQEFNTESYAPIREVEFVTARDNPLSTFSIDVDTASYSNVRRFLEQERTPPADAIRTEELINYFRYDYPQPSGENAFSVNLEMNRAPWNPEHELVRVGLKGREISAEGRGPANLVFLVDVSGSMNSPDKLPLLQRSLSALVENLSDDDRVAIVTYAGSSGLVLDSTQGKAKREILDAIANLRSGGSTNGSGGIKQAYETARQNFLKGGNNRVILCTDGDFNVGVTDQGGLQKLIETERESGVFLSVLGFGTGNLKDSTMETLADKGNGNYAYIDSFSEGRKVLVEQMGSTLFTIAKDVKIQVEFNPARVAGYRLIGYENRRLAKEDFNNDKIDAGEIGAGHTVTALYEIIPAGQAVQGRPLVDPLKYQQPEQKAVTASDEILTVKVRYKAPDGEKSSLLEIPLAASEIPSPDKASEDFRFAAAVAAFGMKLRGSPHVGEIKWAEIQDIARGALGKDPGSYRAEFLTLIEKAKMVQKEAK